VDAAGEERERKTGLDAADGPQRPRFRKGRERAIRDRQIVALGKLALACDGDGLDPAVLAGAILEAARADTAWKEALAAAGRAHFP
jgi:hypothetical protein